MLKAASFLPGCGESSRVRGRECPHSDALQPSAMGTWLNQSPRYFLSAPVTERGSGQWGTESFGALAGNAALTCLTSFLNFVARTPPPPLLPRGYSYRWRTFTLICLLLSHAVPFPHHGQAGWSLVSDKDRSVLAAPLCLSPFGLHKSVQSQILLYLNLLVVYSAPEERLPGKDLLTIIKRLLIPHWSY